MVMQILLTASIAANSTADVTPTVIRSTPYPRALKTIGISGATVNTGKLRVKVDGTEITGNGLINGVTRTAGQVITSDDVLTVDQLINENEQLSFEVDNTSAGALTYYIAYEIEE